MPTPSPIVSDLLDELDGLPAGVDDVLVDDGGPGADAEDAGSDEVKAPVPPGVDGDEGDDGVGEDKVALREDI